MPVKVEDSDAWKDARAALGHVLELIFKKLETEPWSANPQSDYAKLDAASTRIIDELFVLSRIGLRQVDDAIAASQVVSKLKAEAKQAKAEAGKLKAATAKVDEITGVIGKAAGVLTKVVGLPFL